MRKINYHQVYQLNRQEVMIKLEKDIEEIEDYLSSHDDLTHSFIKMMKEDIYTLKNEFHILIDLTKIKLNKIDLNDITHLFNISKELNRTPNFYLRGGDYYACSDDILFLFKDSSLERIKEINDYLINLGIEELRFVETDGLDEAYFNMYELINAHQRINQMVKVVKDNDLSPLEAICFLYYIVCKSFFYQEDEDNPINARSIIGVLNTNKIVCVGYSSLIKAMVDKLENKNLKAETLTIKIIDSDEKENVMSGYIEAGGGHMQNVIIIKDDKYQVEGAYILDATYDSKTERFKTGKGFANFMFPVTDLLHYRYLKIIQYDNNIDEMLGMIGIKAESPDILPVVAKYENYSEPISFEKLTECIRRVTKIIFYNSDDEKNENRVNNTMDLSMYISQNLFTSKASNAIRSEAELYEFE